MDLLKRELAPISGEAWEQIDEEARRVLKLHLAGRKVVDFSGPHGWTLGGVNTGRLVNIEAPAVPEVGHAIRDVRPLIELRSPIVLDILELDYAARGAGDLNLDPVIAAAERVARAEDSAIFHGFKGGNVTGIVEASPHAPIDVQTKVDWPRVVSAAADKLRLAGVNGPYALVLGSPAFEELMSGGDDGYPLRKRITDSVAQTSLVWAPALKGGALLISIRGGDYELTVGQDLSVGYASHDRTKVELYLTESFTFRILEDKAAILLRADPTGRTRSGA